MLHRSYIMQPNFLKGRGGALLKIRLVCFLNFFLPTMSKRNYLFHSRRQQII